MREKQTEISFKKWLGNASQLFYLFGGPPLYLFIFKPSLLEFFVFFVVDSAALSVGILIINSTFSKIFPDSEWLLKPFYAKLIEEMDPGEQDRFIKALISYPKRIATYVSLYNIIKVIPAGLVAVYYWEHDVSNAGQLLRFCFCALLGMTYFFGAIYADNQVIVTQKLKQLSKELPFDWPARFVSVQPHVLQKQFENIELLSMSFTWIFALILQFVVVREFGGGGMTLNTLIVELAIINISALALASRLWYASRNFFFTGLRDIFEAVQLQQPGAKPQFLPLTHSPLLSQFNYSFNSMMAQQFAYEQELKSLIFKKVEKKRFETIGEIAGLTIHDLTPPIQVLHYCLRNLSDAELADSKMSAYIDQALKAQIRIHELIDSLKSYLKSDDRGQRSDLGEAYRYVINILNITYFDRPIDRIDFRLVSNLDNLILAIARPDLIHVLINLMSNSIKNLLENEIADPWIELSATVLDGGEVRISVRDNGTGLSAANFKTLVDPNFRESDDSSLYDRGLGLRLVARLLNQYGATIQLVEPRGSSGTQFDVVAKVAERPAALASDKTVRSIP